jgi:hypothetical protein
METAFLFYITYYLLEEYTIGVYKIPMFLNNRYIPKYEDFPGHIQDKEIYIFPSVCLDGTIKTRNWNVYIRLLQSNNGKHPRNRKINWDITQDTLAPIERSYYNGKIVPNIIGQIWTEQGIVDKTEKYKVVRSVPTYVSKGKNLGKKNETNVFTQSLIQARYIYLEKMRKPITHNTDMLVCPAITHKPEYSSKDKQIKYLLKLICVYHIIIVLLCILLIRNDY